MQFLCADFILLFSQFTHVYAARREFQVVYERTKAAGFLLRRFATSSSLASLSLQIRLDEKIAAGLL